VKDADPIAVVIFLIFLAIALIAVIIQMINEANRGNRRTYRSRSREYTPKAVTFTMPASPSGLPRHNEGGAVATALENIDFGRPGGGAKKVSPARAFVLGLWNCLSFQWVLRFPGWARVMLGMVLIAFLVAIPAVTSPHALLIPGIALSLVLTASGGGFGYLVYDSLRSKENAKIDAENAAKWDRIKQFRCSLVRELRQVSDEAFDYSRFVALSEVSREEADLAADNVYLSLSRKVLADGIITARERSRLELLARSLEIDLERSERIEAKAKTEAYRDALAEAMADGVITEEEDRDLERLRHQLGLGHLEGFTFG
jgi:tellurite resistance protein